ncbi:Type II secretion system protein G precursor [Stieleria magnilauensis]|uniref:Type II secretion system core protein G n=2 Tax=Stieleria magnilauensis TaxID=2527963 RepID=A0ABX5Y5S2_9BACT|nr:Type II secretion system protein G precursor [Planctomycetes bacterium TBK1r]
MFCERGETKSPSLGEGRGGVYDDAGREVAMVMLPTCTKQRDPHQYRNPSRTNDRRGFSLVELIVVMVILGMLAGLVAVRTRGYLVNSRKNAVKAEIATIVNALETYRIDQGRYPTEDEGLEILREETETWPEGFLTKMPVDPWKNPYLYFVSEEGVEVVSLGADGREGGDGEDADFSSAMLEE